MSIFRVTRNFGPPDQQAHEVAGPALIVLYHYGYFMAFPKYSLETTTDLISLGVGCDTAQRRLYVPEDKLLKSEASILEGWQPKYIVQLTRETGREIYEYVCSGTTGQSVRAPCVPLGAAFKRSAGHTNLPPIAASDRGVVRDEDPAEQGAVARCHPTHSDYYRGHPRLAPSMGRSD